MSDDIEIPVVAGYTMFKCPDCGNVCLIEHVESWPTPIPVSEQLPERMAGVLVFDATSGEWDTSIYDGDGTGDRTCSGWYSEASQRFTHWLPLPPAPGVDD